MAFVRAYCTRYTNKSLPDGTPASIDLEGMIEDDEMGVRSHQYSIEGAELAALPAADPATDGTLADPRFLAIMGILAREVKQVHREWQLAWQARIATIVSRPDLEIAALPELTEAFLPPDPVLDPALSETTLVLGTPRVLASGTATVVGASLTTADGVSAVATTSRLTPAAPPALTPDVGTPTTP
jgi:hypothetical protein